MAILPDVLRTGSRYTKWRKTIEKCAKIEEIELLGRFDALTDVNIFICRLVIEETTIKDRPSWWTSKANFNHSPQKIGDYFEVRVGPVVPHRHPFEGFSYPYIHAHQLPSWKSVEAISEYRNFQAQHFYHHL